MSPLLMQDEDRKLFKWFLTRIDWKRILKQHCRELIAARKETP